MKRVNFMDKWYLIVLQILKVKLIMHYPEFYKLIWWERVYQIFFCLETGKVYFILYLMKFKYVPLLAQHLGMCDIWNVYYKYPMQSIYLVDRSFLWKETDLHIPARKTPGPSKSQKHARRTKQVSQFTMRKCWAGRCTNLNFIKYKMNKNVWKKEGDVKLCLSFCSSFWNLK